MVATIFDLCQPREDVLSGTMTDADFAADLAQVIKGTEAPPEYRDPLQIQTNSLESPQLSGCITSTKRLLN